MSAKLQRAVAKVKHHHKRQWVAYVTPTDALVLIAAGASPYLGSREAWDKQRSQGIGNPRWFYFTINTNSELATALGVAK